MIRKYCIRLDRPCPAHTAYALYAAALDRAPADFVDLTHESKSTPVAQYVHGDRWHISLLGEEACNALGPVLESMDGIRLDRSGEWVGLSRPTVSCFDPKAYHSFSRGTLLLHTPTAFKSGGVYQLLPTQHLLLQSLIGKWNSLFDPIPMEQVETLAPLLVYRGVKLESTVYHMKHKHIPGITGSILLENRGKGADGELLGSLLTFGSFSGVGIKTALGMGGMTIHAHAENFGTKEQNCHSK